MAVRQQFGHLGKDAARGLALRHDHGSAFMAEDFQNQIRAWGMLPSYAFVGQPETNGVIERFFRTFKEQVVHGRIFQTIDDFRDAVRDFVRGGGRATAFLALNDRIALGVYQALQEVGLAVPGDVSVLSFDDSELASWVRPRLTSLALPHFEMGRLAVEMLLRGETAAGEPGDSLGADLQRLVGAERAALTVGVDRGRDHRRHRIPRRCLPHCPALPGRPPAHRPLHRR